MSTRARYRPWFKRPDALDDYISWSNNVQITVLEDGTKVYRDLRPGGGQIVVHPGVVF